MADFGHLRISQNASAMVFAKDPVIAIASSSAHLRQILLLGTGRDMSRVTTTGEITGMEGLEFVGDPLSCEQFISDPGRSCIAAQERYLGSASIIAFTEPGPAGVFASRAIYAFPETSDTPFTKDRIFD
jgi:hypothetical protein